MTGAERRDVQILKDKADRIVAKYKSGEYDLSEGMALSFYRRATWYACGIRSVPD